MGCSSTGMTRRLMWSVIPMLASMGLLATPESQASSLLDDLTREVENAVKRKAEDTINDVVDCAFGDEKCAKKAEKEGKEVRVGQPVTATVANNDSLPPGWKIPSAPYPEEVAFVAPQATVRVADGSRTLTPQNHPRPQTSLVDVTVDFKDSVSSRRIIIDNPYLVPADPFFIVPRSVNCAADGSVLVLSNAKILQDGRPKGPQLPTPYAAGLWRIAPDGAITPIAAKSFKAVGRRYPTCGVPFAKSGLTTKVQKVTMASDGSLVFPYEKSILRITADGRVLNVPDSRAACAKPRTPEYRASTFEELTAAVLDPRGNVWFTQFGGCRLSRISPDGSMTTVLTEERACPPEDYENSVLGERLVWDPVHDELVLNGGWTVRGGPKSGFHSTIWRVTPDGRPRRVYYAASGGQTKDHFQVSALSVDAAGRIVFSTGLAIRRLDEPSGTSAYLAGAPPPMYENHRDGPAKEAVFDGILGLCAAPDGTLFILDSNDTIRKLSRDGQVTTWAF